MGEPQPCAVCQGDGFRPVATVTRYAEPFQVVRCDGCGLLQMNPRPRGDALTALYDHGYYAGESDYAYGDDRQLDGGSSLLRSGNESMPPSGVLHRRHQHVGVLESLIVRRRLMDIVPETPQGVATRCQSDL